MHPGFIFLEGPLQGTRQSEPEDRIVSERSTGSRPRAARRWLQPSVGTNKNIVTGNPGLSIFAIESGEQQSAAFCVAASICQCFIPDGSTFAAKTSRPISALSPPA